MKSSGAKRLKELEQEIASLRTLAQPLTEASPDELWRGQLHAELDALAQAQQLIDQVEARLEAMAQADARVGLLRKIPGVGPRLAETVVAMIHDPKRFANAKQVRRMLGWCHARSSRAR